MYQEPLSENPLALPLVLKRKIVPITRYTGTRFVGIGGGFVALSQIFGCSGAFSRKCARRLFHCRWQAICGGRPNARVGMTMPMFRGVSANVIRL